MKIGTTTKAIGKVFGFAVLGVGGYLVVSHFALKPKETAAPTGPTPKTDLPTYEAPTASAMSVAANAPPVEMPVLNTKGCENLPLVHELGYAWNARMGEMFAVGGKQSAKGSLMCKHGVNVALERQDDNNKIQEAMIAFATAWKQGEDNPKSGTHFFSMMGDGAPAFLAGLNPQLQRICGPDCRAVGFVSHGRSFGEDKFMGLQEWKDDPKKAKGAYIAGVCKDGDWNIAIKWAYDNGIENNSNDKVYDPERLNWMCTDGYMQAATAYVNGNCTDLKVRGSNDTKHVCVNGVVTWTPGDVEVARKKGGLVSIVSTREYSGQMPNVVFGFKPWMDKHRSIVKGYVQASLEGAEAVLHSEAALNRAAQVSNLNYDEKETDPDYWKTYYSGKEEKDAQGLTIRLGGSRVHGLADNVRLFGLQPGTTNEYEATYTVFGNIVQREYPKDVPSYPSIDQVLDLSYLREVLAESGGKVDVAVKTAKYDDVANSATRTEMGHRAWAINFNTSSATVSPSSAATLVELMNGLVIQNAASVVIEIHGHTDDTGTPDGNMSLSRMRAESVKRYLMGKAPNLFTEERIKVIAHGQTQPVDPATTESARAKNRRVEVVVLSK